MASLVAQMVEGEGGCRGVTPCFPVCSAFSLFFRSSRCHGDRFHGNRQAHPTAFPWKHRSRPRCVLVAAQGRTLKDRFCPPPLWPRADSALGWPWEASSILPMSVWADCTPPFKAAQGPPSESTQGLLMEPWLSSGPAVCTQLLSCV